MEDFKIYAFLTFLFLGSTSVSAQSMLDLYFGGNKDTLRKYSHRANKSMTPDDYVAGLKAVNKPMLVLMGSQDEAFSSEATKEAILKNCNGEFQIIDKASHNGVRHDAQSFSFVKNWFSKL